jgi:hypothetical protein
MRDHDLLWGGGGVIFVVAIAIVAGLPAQAIASWGIGAAVVGALCWLALGRGRPQHRSDQTSLPAADVLALARDWFAGAGWTLQRGDATDLAFERRLPINYPVVVVLALAGMLPGLIVLLGTINKRQTVAIHASRQGDDTLVEVVVRAKAAEGRRIATQLLERVDERERAGQAAAPA